MSQEMFAILLFLIILGLGFPSIVFLKRILEASSENTDTLEKKVDGLVDNFSKSEVLSNVKQSITSFDKTNNELKSSVSSLTNTVSSIPRAVSASISSEVSTSLQPLVKNVNELEKRFVQEFGVVKDTFEKSHNQLQAVLMTLNKEGNLEEWVSVLQSAVTPLKSHADALTHYYKITENLFANSSQIITQWAEQKAVVDQAYKDLAGLLREWSSAEQIHMREVESRLFDRLQELGEREEKVSSAMEKLAVFITDLTNAHNVLEKSVSESVHQIKSISDKQRDAVATFQGVIDHQMTLQKNMQNDQETIRSNFMSLHSSLSGMLKQYETRMEALDKFARDIVAKQSTALSNLLAIQKTSEENAQKMIKSLDNFATTFEKRIDGVYGKAEESQKQIVQSFSGILDMIANQEQQEKQTKLLVGIVIFQAIMSVSVIISLLK